MKIHLHENPWRDLLVIGAVLFAVAKLARMCFPV